MSAFVFRPFREGDEAALNRAFNEVFHANRSVEEWAWKFPAEPHGRFVMLAFDAAGELLAQYCGVPARMQVDGREALAIQIVDVFSISAGRVGLAAGKAYLGAADGFRSTWCDNGPLQVVYGFPSDRPLKLGSIRLAYADIPPQPVSVWRRSPGPRGRFLTRHGVRAGFDPAAADEVWARARERYPIAIVRDAARLRSRCTGRPGVEYVHLVAWRGDRPHAFAVVRPDRPVTSLVELVWDGEDDRAIGALDRAVAVAARDAGSEAVEGWLDGDAAAAAALAKSGWRRFEHPAIRLVIRSFLPALNPESAAGRVYLTMADSDLV